MSATAPEAAVTITGRKDAVGRSPSDDAAAGVLVAVWCRSVGTSWTLELRGLDRDTALGTVRDWISSGGADLGTGTAGGAGPRVARRTRVAAVPRSLHRPRCGHSARHWLRARRHRTLNLWRTGAP